MRSLPENRQKIIIYGLPMWQARGEDEIPIIGGFWSWILDVLPWNGMMMEYEGSYLRALWAYLTGR